LEAQTLAEDRRGLTTEKSDTEADSGESQPQLRITKEGDGYLRKLLVQGAHHVMSERSPDTDLKRWGMKLAARGERTQRSGRSWPLRESWDTAARVVGDRILEEMAAPDR
jgi:transposase